MNLNNIKAILPKHSGKILLFSALIALFIILVFANKSKIMIESMAVSSDEQYIAYFSTGDGNRIYCVHADGSPAFNIEILPEISAGGYCALWFDNNILHALFYRTKKLVSWTSDGTVLDITDSNNFEYPPEFPRFIRKGHKYIFCGTQLDVIYDEKGFWEYWFGRADRYVSITPKNDVAKTVLVWNAEEGITQNAFD